MDKHKLAAEWVAMRRRSMWALPFAVAMLLVLGGVVWVEGLYRSDAAFLCGVLVGLAGYWTILEGMTIVRVGKLLREASVARPGDATGRQPAEA